MKPLNNDDPGCNYTSSNCVIWQGPDIACINLCKGDSISDVVNKLALELCDVLETLDVVNYDLACLNLTTTPANFHDFIQVLVNTICALQTATGTVTLVATPADAQLPVARIFQYVDAYGNTVTTMPLPNYVTAIGNAVNNQDNQIAVLENVTAVHTSQITEVQARVSAIPDTSQQNLVVPNACILPAVPTQVADVVTVISDVLCALQAATGTPTQLYTAVSKQCTGLATQKTLSNSSVVYNGIPGWNTLMNNAAAAINNMELVLCDVISAIRTVQLCCNNGCSSIALALTANVTGTDINVFLTGTVPPQFIDCVGPGSLVTITDSSGNFFTTHMSILGFVNNPYVISTLSTPVDPTKNITVTIMPCLIDNATSTTCQSVISFVIVSQVNCPVMTYTPFTDEISFSGVPTTGTNTYNVQLYDASSSTLISSVSQSVTFPTVFIGSFPTLGPNLSYTLRVVVTNPSGAVTNCPFFGVALLPTAFVPVPLGTASDFAALSVTGIDNVGSSTFAGLPTKGGVGDAIALYVNVVAGDVITGTLYTTPADPIVLLANTDVTNAISYVQGLTVVTIADNISGVTINPGYYKTTTNTIVLNAAATVTFDGLGDPNSVFIIRASSTLTMGAGAIVLLINGATFNNIFWQIDGLSTIGAGVTMKGTILAANDVNVGAATNIQGAVYTETRMTLNTNTILNL